jgi:large subunit ribosomal protein L1
MAGKKLGKIKEELDVSKKYAFEEAVGIAVKNSYAKFDESVDIAIRLGVDPRHAEQMVRGAVILPHGTGKTARVLVFAKGDKAMEAKEAGADYVGDDDLIEKIKQGWLEFDKAVATPDMMGVVGKIGKILGPRGLMPNAKVGTVTFDVARAIREIKAGKVEFRVEKAGIVHAPVGKVSFGVEKILQNVAAFFEVILRLKPASSKGTYVQSIGISTTMGPGVNIDPLQVKALIK